MLSTLKKKRFTWLQPGKELRFGLLFALSFFLISIGDRAYAQVAPPASGSCVGWLCGPKNALTNAFPDSAAMINTGFLLMQGVVVAILVGIGVVTINKIANREDYGAPMATFFGTVLILLTINYLGGYVVGV